MSFLTRKVCRSTLVSSTIHFNLVALGFGLCSIKLNMALIKLNFGRGFSLNNVMLDKLGKSTAQIKFD